jgi:predicted CXXCH cytochrome family protein
MKKIIVLVALVTLAATSAFGAGITGTAHDLSGAGTGTDEICAFCHTPHNGGTEAPLWNRGAGTTVTIEYTSSTMDAVSGSGGTSDAPLCLSCHDSASLTSVIITNIPNSKTYVPTGLTMSTVADLGTDLGNDHPVGFAYADASADSDILGAPINGVALFGATATDVWCSSCHDVHDNTNAPFLVMSNTSSTLCLSCHNK